MIIIILLAVFMSVPYLEHKLRTLGPMFKLLERNPKEYILENLTTLVYTKI